MLTWIRFKLDWLRWRSTIGYRFGDPIYGTGEARRQTLRLIRERHKAREPRYEDYLK